MKSFIASLLLLLLVVSVKAQKSNPYVFELGGSINSTTIIVPPNKPFDLIVEDLLPKDKASYTYNVTTAIQLQPPLTSPVAGEQKNKPEVIQGADACFDKYKKQYDTATNEVDIKKTMDDAKNDCKTFYTQYTPVTSYTRHFSRLKNQIITITITNTTKNIVWTIILQTELKGQFVTLYGFTFIPYVFSKPHTYFAQAVDKMPGVYSIQRGSSEGIADYAPTISFHYVTNTSGVFSHSLTAGLGAAFSSSNNSGITPVVIFGYSFLYNQNFGLNVGIASDLINKLKGQYQPNQQITTNLESSDLTEKSLGFNPFISVVFRFGSSPFTVKQPDITASSSSDTNQTPPQN